MADRNGKCVLALSGGLDSAVMLAQALRNGKEVTCVSFYYGSKHNPYENRASAGIAKHYTTPRNPVKWIQLSFQSLYMVPPPGGEGPALLDMGVKVPEGHYEEESMRKTVVPFRNGVMVAMLAAVAQQIGASEVLLGAHAGDHFIYPDCRPDFINYMDRAVRSGTDHDVKLTAPFRDIDKAQIVLIGAGLGVPFELTRTCYQAQERACGKCGSCQERLWAFHDNNMEDPIDYVCRSLTPRPPKKEDYKELYDIGGSD